MTVTPNSGSRGRLRNPSQAVFPALRISSPHPPARNAGSPRTVQDAMEGVVRGVNCEFEGASSTARIAFPCSADQLLRQVFHSAFQVNPNPIFFQWGRHGQFPRRTDSAHRICSKSLMRRRVCPPPVRLRAKPLSHGLTPTATCCRRIRGLTPLCDVARWIAPGFCPGHILNRKARFPMQRCGLWESCECCG